MKLRLQYKTFIYTGICFASYLILMQYFQIFKERLDEFTQNGLVSYILTYFVFGIPIFLGTYLINPKISVVRSLGLLHNPLKPLLIAIMFSLPMFIGGLLFFEINSAISIPNMIAGSIVIGLVEESFYRGFFVWADIPIYPTRICLCHLGRSHNFRVRPHVSKSGYIRTGRYIFRYLHGSRPLCLVVC
jgi:hypothetical protein